MGFYGLPLVTVGYRDSKKTHYGNLFGVGGVGIFVFSLAWGSP